MKNLYIKLSILLLAQLCSTAVGAQIEKGTWMARGNSRVYLNKFGLRTIEFLTETGYAFSDRFMVLPSLFTSEVHFNIKTELDLNAGIGLRYYYAEKKSQLKPFAEIGLSSNERITFSDERSSRVYFDTGADYFVHPNLALETSLFFNWNKFFGSDIPDSWGGDLTIRYFIPPTRSTKKSIKKKKRPEPIEHIPRRSLLLAGSFSMEGEQETQEGLRPDFDMDLQARLGMMITKNVALGVTPRLYYIYDDYANNFFEGKYYIQAYGIGGFARVYPTKTVKKIVPFTEFGYRWTASLTAEDSDFLAIDLYKRNEWYGSIGLNYFLHPQVALEVAYVKNWEEYEPYHFRFGMQAFVFKQKNKSKNGR